MHVGSLEVELCRNWLLFESQIADMYLDLFHTRGPEGALQSRGRLCVPEVELIMWPSWIRAFRVPALTDRGDLISCLHLSQVDVVLSP